VGVRAVGRACGGLAGRPDKRQKGEGVKFAVRGGWFLGEGRAVKLASAVSRRADEERSKSSGQARLPTRSRTLRKKNRVPDWRALGRKQDHVSS